MKKIVAISIILLTLFVNKSKAEQAYSYINYPWQQNSCCQLVKEPNVGSVKSNQYPGLHILDTPIYETIPSNNFSNLIPCGVDHCGWPNYCLSFKTHPYIKSWRISSYTR